MTKQEYIEKYGEEMYARKLSMNRARANGTYDEWVEKNGLLNKAWSDERRKKMAETMKAIWEEKDEYKKCEGKHQTHDHEQWKTYMREYRRKYYHANKEKILEQNNKYLARRKANDNQPLNTKRGRKANDAE